MKKHLHECLGWSGPVTHRQMLAWQEWFKMDWNTPSRADHYAMQIATEVARVLHKNPASVKMEHMKVRFSWPKPIMKVSNNTEILSKQIWMARVGMIELVNPDSSRIANEDGPEINNGHRNPEDDYPVDG